MYHWRFGLYVLQVHSLVFLYSLFVVLRGSRHWASAITATLGRFFGSSSRGDKGGLDWGTCPTFEIFFCVTGSISIIIVESGLAGVCRGVLVLRLEMHGNLHPAEPEPNQWVWGKNSESHSLHLASGGTWLST